MNLKIRKSERGDIPNILLLIREFAEFENLSEYCEVTEESLQAAIFGENSFVESLIALADDRLVGYAIFFPYFASFRGQRGLYLEDIYLKPEFRQAGLGEKILREIARAGAEKGCLRIDFQVLKHNQQAINFYEKLGAIKDESETHFKFTDHAFQNLAK